MKELKVHFDEAKTQGKIAISRIALGAMFASFGGYIPQPFGHVSVFGGGAIVAALNILPTLFCQKLDKTQKKDLLTALEKIKKLVAAAEGAAITGVFVEQGFELTQNEAGVEQLLKYLLPSFAIILAAQGTLDLIAKIEKMLSTEVDLAQSVNLVVGSGGTLAQAGMITGVLTGLVDKQTANGINALIGGGQALTAGFMTFWNLRKASQYTLTVDSDMRQPLSVSDDPISSFTV